VRSNWADGVAGITQCSLAMGDSYTYEFTLIDQVGTYFWHAHVGWLRATVYGAIIIHPTEPPPYATPAAEMPVLFGKLINLPTPQSYRFRE
jgi:laccase